MAKKTILILSVLTALSTLFLGLRLAMKRKILRIDDWLLYFTVLLLWWQAVDAYIMAIKGGEGNQIKDLTPNELEWLLKPELGYTICIATIKISVLLSLKFIFGQLRWFRYAVFTLGALTSIWFIGVFFSVAFQCTPVDKVWQPLKPGHCIVLKPFLYGNSLSNTVLDYSILLLPVVPVLRLHMSPVQKFLVLFSFSLGSLSVCLFRIVEIKWSPSDEFGADSASISTLHTVQTRTVDLDNLSATIFKDSIWTYIEPNASVLSACLPCLTHVFKRRYINFLGYLSSLAGKATSLLKRSSGGTDHSSKHAKIVKTLRAAH